MKIIVLIYFFIMMWGLGYSLISLLKLKFAKGFERHIMLLGIGLGIFPILTIIMNTVRMPLIWYIYLILALIVPIKDIFMKIINNDIKFKIKTPKLTKSNIALIILFILFFTHLFVFVKGSSGYPYLEDGDSWTHADVSQYIAQTHSYSLPKDDWKILHYTEPYPPAFAAMNAMLYQLDPDIKWILKFFNSLIISLGILFFYFFMAGIMKSKTKALYAAFLLTVVPAYLSHFIFAASLSVTLFFPAFYALNKIKSDKHWVIVAAIISASIFVTQPITAGVYAFILGFYWLMGVILYKNLQKDSLMAIVGGVLLALIYYVFTFVKFGFDAFTTKLGFGMFIGGAGDSSGGVIYRFIDYLISPSANKIDQATGYGPFFFIMLLGCIIFFIVLAKKLYLSEDKERSRWIFLSMILFFITFLATQSNRFPYKFFPHRVWVYMTIAAVIILAFGTFSLMNSILANKGARAGVIAILVLGILLTSGIPKYKVQTSTWPFDGGYFPLRQDTKTGQVYSPEISGFAWMEDNLDWNSKVMDLCWESDQRAVGFNFQGKTADREVRKFKANIDKKTAESIVKFAKKKGYDYIIFGITCVIQGKLEEEIAQKMLGGFQTTNVNLTYTDGSGMFVFQVR